MLTFRLIFLYFILFFQVSAHAEPYLAARTGHRCMACHVSPTGGGMRTDFGQIYGQSLAADKQLQTPFSSRVSDNIRLGANFRGGLLASDTNNESSQNSFQIKRANIYIHAQLIDNLSFYIDQQLAPANENRTAWIKYQSADSEKYVRAGQFYLPYGLRLEDDSAFIRQVTGINFATADNGIEYGWEKNNWSTQFSITNGTAGAAENNPDKQISLRLVYIKPDWRLGTSFNHNESTDIRREMSNIFAMLNYLDIEWLFEIDQIKDISDITSERFVSFFELNKEIIKGHNIKLSFEYDDPDTNINEDERTRNSIVWEYFSSASVTVSNRI